jgi:putative ABC transport system permease protein
VIQHLRTALDLFRTQKARFLLTVSGIVVGVGSLVLLASLLAVGQDVLRRTSSSATGDDVITVGNDWEATMNDPSAVRLRKGDRDALARSTLLPDGTTVTATYGMRDRAATFGTENLRPFTIGIGAETLGVYNLAVGEGRPFSTYELENARRVTIAGHSLLEGKIRPGDVIRVEGSPFTVVGILEKKPEMGPGGPWDWNNRLLFPASTYHIAFDPSERPSNIVVKVSTPPTYQGLVKDYVLAVRDVVDAILMQDRTVKSYEFEGVSDDSSTEVLILRTIEALIYLTTVFSMLVGAIKIMNIMLVTVVERTREIGVRRALGATRGDIVRQFLSETVAITLVGALVGLLGALVLLGGATYALDRWVIAWPFHVETWSIGVAIALSTIIGFAFGLYPAWLASRLDPVEALRFE